MESSIDPPSTLHRPSATVEPGQQGLACLGHEFELNGPLGLLLHDRRAISDRTAGNDVANLHFDDITTAKLAVDRQIEKRSVLQPPMLVEKETYCPYVSGLERALRADHIASVPRTTPMSVGVKVRYSHVTSPLAGMANGNVPLGNWSVAEFRMPCFGQKRNVV
jgi:hypothetical protein